MTLQSMIEDIQRVHPTIGRTQLIFDINNALKEFAEKTRCLYAKTTLTRASHLISEDLNELIWKYTIPADLWEARSASCCLQEEIEVTGPTEITFRFNNDPSADIDLIYQQYPPAIAAMADVPTIHELYLPAVIARVKEKYYRAAGVPQLAAIEHAIWREGVAEGQRFANTRPLRNLAVTVGSNTVTSARGRLALVQGWNLVPIGATFADTNYFIVWNETGVQVNEYNPNDNAPPDTRTTTTFEVLAADAVSNFEFIIEHN